MGYGEAIERAKRREYAEVEFSWEGVIPVDIFIEMQRIKSELEKRIKENG